MMEVRVVSIFREKKSKFFKFVIVLIMGICRACRRDELVSINVDNIEEKDF